MRRAGGSAVGLGSLLLGLALGAAALPDIAAGREYVAKLGWLDLQLDGLSLYFALLTLLTIAWAGFHADWPKLVYLLPLAAAYLLVRSYALGEWPLAGRVAVEGGFAALLLAGLALLTRRTRLASLLIGGGMVGLALGSGQSSAVAGGLLLILDFGFWILDWSITPLPVGGAGQTPLPPGGVGGGSEKPQSPPPRLHRWGISSTIYLLPSTSLIGLWLYLHAAVGRGEWLYAALMLAGAVGRGLIALRVAGGQPRVGGAMLGANLVGFAAGAVIVDLLLRPALVGLAGLPAWRELAVQRLDLPAPQPDTAVGLALVGSDGATVGLLPVLAMAVGLVFALALAWLLYRVLTLLARLGGQDDG